MADHYETLGLSRGAYQAIVRTDFRRLALIYHPDKNKSPNTSAKFREISAAYQTLGKPLRRAEYDKSLPFLARRKVVKPVMVSNVFIASGPLVTTLTLT